MGKISEKFGNILVFILEILAGVILLINPTGFTSAIIIVAGVVLLITGICDIIKYFRTDPIEALKEQTLSNGLILSTIGLFCVFKSEWFIATFPIISILYGIAILISGFVKIQWMVDSIRLKGKNWFVIAISAVLSIIFAIIIIRNPFTSTVVLWQFTGIILIIEAILDIISVVLDKSKE